MFPLEGSHEKVFTRTANRAALTVLQSMRVASKLTLEFQNILNSFAEVRVLELLWIAGHTGFRNNEIMVRQGAG